MTDGVQNDQNIHADNNSVAVGSLSVGGSVDGSLVIGSHNVVGFTSGQVSTLIAQISTTFQPKPFDGRSPYKGLDVFEEEDAELFFGREKLVEDLVARVKASRTLFVTGPSGSGKSSLVRAGLIHALKQGAIQNLYSERWLYATLKPGRDPFEAMAGAFSRLKSPELGDYFLQNSSRPEVLHKCAESTLSERNDQRLALFIDQFEEIFTQLSKDKAQAFVELLAHAADVENGRVLLLFAMRSDFIPNCVIYPKLNTLLNRQFVQIGAMQGDELVSAIAQPALRVGLRIDPDLIAQIINDMQGEPGALPLMQFALKDLFDAQQAKGGLIALMLKDYLERGGIRKALERHADNSFNRLNGHERKLTRAIFSSLIEIGRGTVDTRRTAVFDELVPASARSAEVEAIVRKLADARLLTTDEVAGKDTVTISHEKLIDAWPWLKKLVDENRDVIAAQNEIAKDAKEWEDHGRDPSYLYSGARLGVAQEQLAANKIMLSGLAKDFLEEGIALREAEKKAKEDLRRRIIGGLIAGIAIALVLAGFAAYQMVLAQRQEKIAIARQLASQAQSIYATHNSDQMIAALVAIQSMKVFPNGDAAIFLMNNNDSAPLTSRMTYDGAVSSVAFNQDGKYVVSAGCDEQAPNGSCAQSSARVWEAASGQEVARMIHEGSVNSVAFSQDGKHVVSGSGDGTAHVWEAATGRELARMTQDGEVNSVAFSPDGKYVVSRGCDELDTNGPCIQYSARVWEATTGRELARMTQDGEVNSVAFSPDGKYVVSGGWDGTARVWEATTGREVARMTHDDGVSSVAFSPDGKYVVSGSYDATARVWEATTGQELTRMTYDGEISSVAFSPDGKYVVSGSVDGTARVWEAATGQEVALMTHDGEVNSLAFSSDGKYVVSGSYDATARVWEATTGQEVARMTTNAHWVPPVAFSPDGKYVVSGGCDQQDTSYNCAQGIARVWEVPAGQGLARINQDGEVSSLAFSPDGKYVVSGSYDGTARVWEAITGREIGRMTQAGSVSSLAFSPDGKYVVSGGCDQQDTSYNCAQGIAHVWEAATGQEVARMIQDSEVNSLAFSADEKYVISGSGDGTVRVWEAITGREIGRMTQAGSVSSLAFSPDGKYVVSGSYDATARVWEAATGRELARMTLDGSVYSVAFSPDGKYVVSGSVDGTTGTARVWEATTGRGVARMTHEGSVDSVAFSPDGKYVVSGSSDGTARVWEAATGREVARMTHNGLVRFVAFSPDGKHVVSGSGDGMAQTWAWQAGDLIANACAVMPRNLTRAEWDRYIGDALPYPAKQKDVTCPNLPIQPEGSLTPTAIP